jgi:hypothetical protein
MAPIKFDAIFPSKFCDDFFLKCFVTWFSRLATLQSDIQKIHVSNRLLTGPSSPFYEWRSLSEWCQYLSVLMTRSVSEDKKSPDYSVTTPLTFTMRLSVVRLSPSDFLFKFTSYNLLQVCCVCTRFSLCKQSLSYSRPCTARSDLRLILLSHLAVTAVLLLERL